MPSWEQPEPQADEVTPEMLGSLSLAEIRQARNVTQAQIAERMGISQGDVSRIEQGRDSRISTLRRYLKALNMDLGLVARFVDPSDQKPKVVMIRPPTSVRRKPRKKPVEPGAPQAPTT